MNFLADEGVDRPVVEHLRGQGHTVLYIADIEPGLSDARVLEMARTQSALLLTADKDFGELVFRMNQVSAGVILLRLAGLAPSAKAQVVAAALREHGGELQSAFTVISPGAIRIRRR